MKNISAPNKRLSNMRKAFTLATITLGLLSYAFNTTAASNKANKPNFLWIISEDNSSHYLKMYNERGIETPAIEKLAQQGLIYDKAYSNGAVCSVARTTLAAGVYAPRIASQYHRASFSVNMPEGAQLIHQYLKDLGYYTTNNSKLDYNLSYIDGGSETWDESSTKATWRHRKNNNQPFFHIQTYKDTHEGQLFFDAASVKKNKLGLDLAKVKLASYHPDDEIFRYTHAYFNSRMKMIDNNVEKLVAQLEADGELENTFIFYFGDHGGVLPRSKGYIYESGTKVPLVIRVPENFKHLVNSPLNSRVKGTVEFVDFGATILNLAGISKLPTHLDGKPFLGKNISHQQVEAQDTAFSYADKMGEKFDLMRGLNKGKYQYIRSYQPYIPDALTNNYRYKMLAFSHWRDLYHQGKLNPTQSLFFQPKPAEALYDTSVDQDEVNNLANDPKYKFVLQDMRNELTQRLKSMADLGFYPESYLAQNIYDLQPDHFAKNHQQELSRLIDIANWQLLPFVEAKPLLNNALTSNNPMVRHWALTAAISFGKEASVLWPTVKLLTNDKYAINRTRVAEFMVVVNNMQSTQLLSKTINSSIKYIEILEALNALTLTKEFYPHLYKKERLKPKITTVQIAAVIERL